MDPLIYCGLPWQRTVKKEATEQRLLLETYEEFKDVITKKGNTAAINKAREKLLIVSMRK